ncbi:helix-turn-helix domain-containing protein [Pseudonocardia yunnanensis]
MNRNADLGTFLRSRRARLDPADVGLPSTGRRRVPGLRREELAAVAGVSAGYYARLEQGRQVTASPSVLDALARALRLTADERRHLYTLAGTADTTSVAGLPEGAADPRARRIVDVFGDTPAMLCGPYTDVLLANAAASFLLTDFSALPAGDRYAIKWHLLAPETRELYGADWEGVTVDMIGMLRLQAARHPRDPRMRDLVAELGARSPLFRRQWAEHRVSAGLRDRKVLNHPDAGKVAISVEMLILHVAPENTLVLLIPDDAHGFETALHKFATAA